MWLVFALFGLAFIFFLFEKSWKIHAAIVSGFLTITLAFTGMLDPGDIYRGFSDNTVVTVILMLAMTGALERSGLAELLVHGLTNFKFVQKHAILSLFVLVMILSGYMNDIGALAIVMPVALVVCNKLQIPAPLVLMPLSFGALLGGLLTKVGTPPNLIISDFRESAVGEPFKMFDYTPVGFIVCLVGGSVTYALKKIVFKDERYQKIPEKNDSLLFKGFYPIMIHEGSPLIRKRIGSVEELGNSLLVPRLLLRNNEGLWSCKFKRPYNIALQHGDIVMLKIDKEHEEQQLAAVENMIATGLFSIVPEEVEESILESLLHVGMVTRKSNLIKPNQPSPGFRDRFRLLPLVDKQAVKFFPGRVLSFIGEKRDFEIACERYKINELNAPTASIDWSRFNLVLITFVTALVTSSLGLIRLEHSLGMALLALLTAKEITFDDLRKSLDIPLLVLIATMLVNAKAFETSEAATTVAGWIIQLLPAGSAWLMLSGLILSTIVLTNIVSNSACAAIMAPIGISLAESIAASPDPFLMGICIASSCAFMSPIAHPCNLAVYNAGSYSFSCYFRLGLWTSIAVWIASSITIPLFWHF